MFNTCLVFFHLLLVPPYSLFATLLYNHFMEITKEREQNYKAFDRAYENFEKFVFDWGTANKPLMREIQEHLHLEKNEEYLPDYFIYSAPALMLERILTDIKMLKRIKASQEKFMVSREKRVLELLLEKPAFWCFFAIKEILEDDFVLIEDLFRDETHLMHSPSLCLRKKNEGSEQKTYLSLMIYNGEGLVNIGLLRIYILSKSDMRFYCSRFAGIGFDDSEFDLETTLDEVISEHYNDFFTLDKKDAVVKKMYEEYEIRHTWQPFYLEEFDIDRLEGFWITTHMGEQTRYTLVDLYDDEKEDIPYGKLYYMNYLFMDGVILRDHASGEMGLINYSEISYKMFAAILQKAYPELGLPQQPEVSIPSRLLDHITEFDLNTPWKKFEALRLYREEEGI